jgi:hypothetical protein
VAKADQTITFNALSNQVFAPNKTFTLGATSSSGLPVVFTSLSTNVVTISGNVATIRSGGTARIVASQAGNANFNAAPTVEQPLTVTATNQTINFTPPANQVYAPNRTFALAATASSGRPVTFTSLDTNVVGVSSNVATIRSGGTARIVASQGGDLSYLAAAPVTNTVVINKAPQTITFNAPVVPVYSNTATFPLSASNSSGLPVSFVSANPAIVSVASNVATILSAGTVALTATNTGDGNYAPAGLARTVTITKALQTITFNPQLTNTFAANGLIALNGSSSSGLPVSYVSANTNILRIVGTNAEMRAKGTTTVTASQPGNTNYSLAPNVVRTILVN